MTFLARHEHDTAQKFVGRASMKPVLGRAQAPPQAQRAVHGTTQ
jgi:hypothetical protein